MNLPCWILVTALACLVTAPAAAQFPVLIYGRVEEAATRLPIEGVRVFAVEGSDAAFTDVDGRFALRVPEGAPYVVGTEGLGYLPQDFRLEGDPLTRSWTLLVETVAVELAAVNAVAETAVEKVLKDLRYRRNSYQGAVQALDRTALERFTAASVWDVVRSRSPGMFRCDARSGLCVLARTRTPANPVTRVAVSICLDGWDATELELDGLDVESVALLEIYSSGRGGIRVYTPQYLLTSARTGRNMLSPLMGC